MLISGTYGKMKIKGLKENGQRQDEKKKLEH